MVLATTCNWSNAISSVASILRARIFGYALTMSSSCGRGLRGAVGIALAADTVSITIDGAGRRGLRGDRPGVSRAA